MYIFRYDHQKKTRYTFWKHTVNWKVQPKSLKMAINNLPSRRLLENLWRRHREWQTAKERSHCFQWWGEKNHQTNVEFGLPHKGKLEKVEIRLAAENTLEGNNTGELEILDQHLGTNSWGLLRYF